MDSSPGLLSLLYVPDLSFSAAAKRRKSRFLNGTGTELCSEALGLAADPQLLPVKSPAAIV